MQILYIKWKSHNSQKRRELEQNANIILPNKLVEFARHKRFVSIIGKKSSVEIVEEVPFANMININSFAGYVTEAHIVSTVKEKRVVSNVGVNPYVSIKE